MAFISKKRKKQLTSACGIFHAMNRNLKHEEALYIAKYWVDTPKLRALCGHFKMERDMTLIETATFFIVSSHCDTGKRNDMAIWEKYHNEIADIVELREAAKK